MSITLLDAYVLRYLFVPALLATSGLRVHALLKPHQSYTVWAYSIVRLICYLRSIRRRSRFIRRYGVPRSSVVRVRVVLTLVILSCLHSCREEGGRPAA